MTPKQSALAALTALADNATWDAIFEAIDATSGTDDDFTPEYKAEIMRRVERIESGEDTCKPWEQLVAEIKARYADEKRGVGAAG